MTFRDITKVRPEWYKRPFRSRTSVKKAKSPSYKEAREEIMAYRTRLTVSTAIRETVEGIRTRTQDRNRFDGDVKRCAANLVYFIEKNGTGPDSGMLALRCVELLFGVLAAIRAHFQNLEDRLEAFKAGDTKILVTKEMKLAEDLIRVAEERERYWEEFFSRLNTELVDIIHLESRGGRHLDAIDRFIKVAEVIENAKTELSTL